MMLDVHMLNACYSAVTFETIIIKYQHQSENNKKHVYDNLFTVNKSTLPKSDMPTTSSVLRNSTKH
jgi:hypothetical protein